MLFYIGRQSLGVVPSKVILRQIIHPLNLAGKGLGGNFV